MADKKTIYIRLSGGFMYRQSSRDKWKQLDGSISCGRKLRSFIEYLIVNHGSDIPSDDLRERFWPADQSTNPVSSLKYTMHKARGVLNVMFPEYADDMVWTVRGYFIWNPDIRLKIDIETFENKCRLIRKKGDEISADDIMSVLSIYRGDALPGNDMEWAKNIRLHCRALYIDLANTAVMRLKKQDRWEDIVSISEKVCSIEPGEERFTCYRMESLMKIGQPNRAMEHYELYSRHIWKKYRRIPSEQVERLYDKAVRSQSDMDGNSESLLNSLTEMKSSGKAFMCSFSVFRSLVEVELRRMKRDGFISSAALISLMEEGGTASPEAALRCMEKTILDSLRVGDAVSRLDTGAFVVLLHGAALEGAKKTIERLKIEYRTRYKVSKTEIISEIRELEHGND